MAQKIEVLGRDNSGILLCMGAGRRGPKKPFDATPRPDLWVCETEPGIYLIIKNQKRGKPKVVAAALACD